MSHFLINSQKGNTAPSANTANSMLAKQYKLTKADNIKGILNKGKQYSSQYFVIKTQETEEPISRFSIVISNKISKKAVIRNKLRRQLFEIIRLHPEETSLKKPHKIVILPRTRALQLDYNRLETELIQTFKAKPVQKDLPTYNHQK
ncbi:ribonuclease P protein component [Candidatus Peregrinibacteria bacterium CG10_big_fil_rev_8_21_14_0_10_44_7]|nr:MAG: ribonuclease P protein component [Candidatus Peregrinibacteria bacterium CG10_big_fil_rev_8_21_14_0_10_44_7]